MKNNEYTICFTCDDNYIKYCAVAMSSIISAIVNQKNQANNASNSHIIEGGGNITLKI